MKAYLNITLFILTIISSSAFAQGFDENYLVYQGDLTNDGDDLYITRKQDIVILHGAIATPIALPRPVDEFILENDGNGNFNLITNLTTAQKSEAASWSPIDPMISMIDANLDGNLDLVTIGISEFISGAYDQIIYSGPTKGDNPFYLTSKNLDFQSFYGELNEWMFNPNFYADNAPPTNTGTEPGSRIYAGSVNAALPSVLQIVFLSYVLSDCYANAPSNYDCAVSFVDPGTCIQTVNVYDIEGNYIGIEQKNVCVEADFHVFSYIIGSTTIEDDYSIFNQDAMETAVVLDRLNADCPAIITTSEQDLLEGKIETIYGADIFSDGSPMNGVLQLFNTVPHAAFPGDSGFSPFTNPTYHHYDEVNKICDIETTNCTLSVLKDTVLKKFSYPSFILAPINTELDGEELWVWGSIPPSPNKLAYVWPSGQITQQLLQGTWTGAIQNITEENHVFFPGTISRTIITKNDSLYSFTHGIGYNKAYCTPPLFKPLHMLLSEVNFLTGPLVFETLDKAMEEYWEVNY